MIAFHLEYTINPDRIHDFQTYAQQFMELTEKYGGNHYGYFLDSRSDKTTAIALFAFTDIEHYDYYRKQVLNDPKYDAAMELAKRTKCITYCQRTIYDRQIA